MSSANTARGFGGPLTFAQVTFVVGASGAVPAASTWRGSNKGAMGIVRSNAGQYTVTWDARFKGSLLGANVAVRAGASGGNPTITQGVAIGIPDRTATVRTVKFSTLTSGAVADLASGSEVTVMLTFTSPQS